MSEAIDPTIAALMAERGIKTDGNGSVRVTRQPRNAGLWAQTVEAARRAWDGTVADMGGQFGMTAETKQRLAAAPGAVRPLQVAGVEMADVVVKGYHALGAAFEATVAGLNELSDESGFTDATRIKGGRGIRLGDALGAAAEYPGNPAAALEGSVLRLSVPRPKPVTLRVARSVKAEAEAKAIPAPAAKPKAKALELETPATAPEVPAITREASAESPQPPRTAIAADAKAGELLTADELTGDPHRARKLVDERLGTLSEQEAAGILARVTKAMEAGDVVDDPFFRSLLHVDTSAVTSDPQKLLATLEVFDDALEGLAARAGAGRMTSAQFLDGFNKLKARGVLLEDLMKNAEDSRRMVQAGRLGVHAMTLAGHEFIKAREALLPRIVAKEAGAREQLVQELVRASQIFALGKAPASNAGRTLRFLKDDIALGLEKVADDLEDLPDPKMVERRVRDALAKMDDDDVADFMSRIATTDDLGRIDDILLNEEAAASYGRFRRAREFVSKALRSNALSPATGLYNAASMVIHDFFRADLSRTWAARRLTATGRLDEATALQLERDAGRAVYWEAHKRGIKAMIDRIKWETWTEVEKVASVGWGDGSVAAGARAKRSQLLAEGYRAPELREFEARPGLGLTSSEVVEFNARQQALADDGSALARLLAFDERAEAVGRNLVDALSGASMKLFTGSLDDWGRAFVHTKELHVQSTRFAVREGLSKGLQGDELAEFVKARAQQLAEMPSGGVMDAVERAALTGEELSDEAKFIISRERLMEDEAKQVLFMDGPQSAGGRALANGLGLLDPVGFIFPYVKTPVRLLERGLIDYTPLAEVVEANRKVLQRGGPDAELLKARMHLGAMGIGLGATLAAAGAFVVTNGGFENTAGLASGPPNRLQVGDFYVELNRLDPFVTTLVLGGFIGQAAREGFTIAEEFDVSEGMKAATAAAVLGIKDGVLSKTYLTGLRDIIDATGAADEHAAQAAMRKLLQNAGVRLVPLAGSSRQLNDTLRDTVPETVTFVDQVLRAIPGAGLFAPVKRDLLGHPVKSREFGVWAGRSDQLGGGDEPVDAVTEQLRDLKLDLKDIRRMDPRGFALTAEQLDQLRLVRATEARNAYGQTLKEALADLFDDEEFRSAGTRDAKQKLVAARIGEFNEPARAILAERDPAYAGNREGYRAFKEYLEKDLLPTAEAQARATEDAEALGLPAPVFD